jgi:hypothetical protein
MFAVSASPRFRTSLDISIHVDGHGKKIARIIHEALG